MSLDFILKPSGVVLDLHACCKREALQALASKAAALLEQPESDIMSTILEREQLGSTAVGGGVAIPHGKIEGLQEITGVLARLEKPLEFDALDEQPVDIVFMLLAPANATAAHLKALAKVSRFLRSEETLSALRGAESVEAAYAIASTDKKSNAA